MKINQTVKYFIAGAVGVILGSGGLWQYLQYTVTADQLELDRSREIISITKEMLSVNLEIIELSNNWIELDQEIATSKLNDVSKKRELTTLKHEIELRKSLYLSLEGELAKIEKRAVRKINLDYFPIARPASPTGFYIK